MSNFYTKIPVRKREKFIEKCLELVSTEKGAEVEHLREILTDIKGIRARKAVNIRVTSRPWMGFRVGYSVIHIGNRSATDYEKKGFIEVTNRGFRTAITNILCPRRKRK